MQAIAFVLGIFGNILSMLVLAAPLPTFWRIYKRGSTESYSSLPYVCTLLSNMLWLYYALNMERGGLLLLTVATAGCAFELLYISLYFLYTGKAEKGVIIGCMLTVTSIFCIVVVLTMKLTRGSLRLRVVGALCAFNSICMYASPLSIVRVVITTKSVEYMPFLLSLSLFLCGGVWLGYAIVVKDLYVGVSNGTGFFLGIVQLCLYAVFCNYGKTPRGKGEAIIMGVHGAPPENNLQSMSNKKQDVDIDAEKQTIET